MDRPGTSHRRTRETVRRRYRERTPTPTPSPSLSPSPQHSPPTTHRRIRGDTNFHIHLPTQAMRVRYESEFSNRSVLLGKDYDMDGLNQWYNFNEALCYTGLVSLMDLPDETYVDLVRIFYSNATTHDVIEDDNVAPWVDSGRQSRDSITTFMFGCVIKITPDYLNGVFHQTNGGDKLRKNWDMTNAFHRVFNQASAPICPGERQSDHLKHLRQKDLLPICRLIHHMIGYNICPRANTNNVSVEDVYLMDAMMDRRALDVGYLVIQCMRRVLGRKDAHLAYGRLITRILQSWGFDISNYTKVESRSKFTNSDIARRLGFKHDPETNQYIRDQGGVGATQQGPGDGNESNEQSFDLNLDDLSLPLPWHDEGMGDGHGQWQGQAHQQSGSGSYNMNDIMNTLIEITKVQKEHGELLNSMSTHLYNFSEWSGFRPTHHSQPPPPQPQGPQPPHHYQYQPPGNTENQDDQQGGQSPHSHHFF